MVDLTHHILLKLMVSFHLIGSLLLVDQYNHLALVIFSSLHQFFCRNGGGEDFLLEDQDCVPNNDILVEVI